jgi:hypothetical protein
MAKSRQKLLQKMKTIDPATVDPAVKFLIPESGL